MRRSGNLTRDDTRSELRHGGQYRGELEMAARHDYLAAIESLSRALSLNQPVAGVEKREARYRWLDAAG